MLLIQYGLEPLITIQEALTSKLLAIEAIICSNTWIKHWVSKSRLNLLISNLEVIVIVRRVQMTNIAWNGNLRSNGANGTFAPVLTRITVFLSLYNWIPTPERSSYSKISI
jgi:hypothetical protein